MTRRRIPQKGDVYWIDPNPTSGREIKDKHRFIVITQKALNKLGTAIVVPVVSGGKLFRTMPLTVPIMGHDTTGVAVCHQVRSFDIETRLKQGSAKYIESLDPIMIESIIDRVVSVIDPADP